MYIVTGITVLLLFIRYIGEHYNNNENTNKISKRRQKQKKKKKKIRLIQSKSLEKKRQCTANFQTERWPLQ